LVQKQANISKSEKIGKTDLKIRPGLKKLKAPRDYSLGKIRENSKYITQYVLCYLLGI
jgi:hypothetical protein